VPTLPVFRETQRLRQAWVIGLSLTPALLAWYVFVVQILLGQEVGTNPAPDWAVWLIFALVGVGLPLLVFSARLSLHVDDACLDIHYFPFLRRDIFIWDIASAEAVTYRPMRLFWGWGIRWSPSQGWAYTARGHHGVRVTLKDGRRLLIGSQRPNELAAAINGRLACAGDEAR
jgi:hypothetical protein